MDDRKGALVDRDYDECRNLTKPDPAIAALYGAFGAVGVFFGTNANDSRIRACLQAKGWTAPATPNDAATAGTAARKVDYGTANGAPAPQTLKAAEAESPAAKRLKELKSLLDQGLITNKEYEDRRQAILNGL